jgi:hypothetical protein
VETGVAIETLVPVFNWSSPGEVDWAEFFGALRDLQFDGIATVCVFGREESADGRALVAAAAEVSVALNVFHNRPPRGETGELPSRRR